MTGTVAMRGECVRDSSPVCLASDSRKQRGRKRIFFESTLFGKTQKLTTNSHPQASFPSKKAVSSPETKRLWRGFIYHLRVSYTGSPVIPDPKALRGSCRKSKEACTSRDNEPLPAHSPTHGLPK